MTKTIQQLSIDARLLTERLLKTSIGDTVTYADLSETISRDITSLSGRSALASARRVAQREKGAVFDCVRKVGLKRLDDVGIVEGSAGVTARIRRTARRGMDRLAAVQSFDQMPHAARVQHNATMSVLGAIRSLAGPMSIKRVEDKVSAAPLPTADTLKIFAGVMK